MPTINCPHCNRMIEYGLDEISTVFACAGCGGKFTPIGGPLEELNDRAASETLPGEEPFGDQRGADGQELVGEPWFYGFLTVWAYVVLALGLLACLILTVRVLDDVMAHIREGREKDGWITLLVGLIKIALTVVGTLVIYALMHLWLDTGRNVRQVLLRGNRRE
jgi:hypothetical protein